LFDLSQHEQVNAAMFKPVQITTQQILQKKTHAAVSSRLYFQGMDNRSEAFLVLQLQSHPKSLAEATILA